MALESPLLGHPDSGRLPRKDIERSPQVLVSFWPSKDSDFAKNPVVSYYLQRRKGERLFYIEREIRPWYLRRTHWVDISTKRK